MRNMPYFHHDTASVRFWVEVNGQEVGASVSQQTLHYSFQPQSSDDDALATFLAHSDELEDAVRRRIAAGSLEPVMLREHDLRKQP